jgi:hypothetical protein
MQCRNLRTKNYLILEAIKRGREKKNFDQFILLFLTKMQEATKK